MASPISIESLIQSSQCYGHCYDRLDASCMRCEAWFTCRRKTLRDHPAPATADARPGGSQ